MLRPAIPVLLLLFASICDAQSRAGITGRRDTSYTTYHAYQADKEKYPQIEVVPELATSTIRQQKSIPYCQQQKRVLVLDAFQPTDSSRQHTAIIIIHGGGWRSGNRTQHYPLAQHLARLGYVCFTPEYRLSTEALFPAGVYDIKAAIRWVRSRAGVYGIDTSKIAVLGFSAGGELAAFMGTTGNMPLFEGSTCNTSFPSHVNAVIDIDGTLSFVHPDAHEGDDSRHISAATYWFGYPRIDKEKLWEAASPLSYAGRQTPPTLFINSSVPWMHAGREEYRNRLEEYKIYTEVKEFPEAPHSFCLYHPWFGPTVTSIDLFLKKVFPR